MQVHMPGGMKMLDKSTDVVAGTTMSMAVLSWVNPDFQQWLTDLAGLLGPLTTVLAFLWFAIRFGIWGWRRIKLVFKHD